MAIVVPFRGAGGKSRLAPKAPEVRTALALAMLADVAAACAAVDRTLVVTADLAGAQVAAEHGAEAVDDPGGGQGDAVSAALQSCRGAALIVNADVPAVVPDDLRELLAAIPAYGLALVRASDGTTNALALSDAALFRPLFGPESADRFLAFAHDAGVPAAEVEIPSLVDDVDTLDDLLRVRHRAGPRTLAALEVTALEAVR